MSDRAHTISILTALLTSTLFWSAISGCEQSSEDPSKTPDKSTDSARQWFIDIAEQSGLDFVHTTGATGEYFFPEIAGSGCGLFDYDNDGDLDVYINKTYPLGEVD